MPKVGMGLIRRKALIDATIKEVGLQGSLDVTVGQIARRAGVSSGLAHHYFGDKEQIFLAAMRHILSVFGKLVLIELARADTPTARLEAIVRASLHVKHFDPEIISAWLAFYVQAQHSSETQRLLRVYAKRLHSNLIFNLRALTTPGHAEKIAHGMAALIDGFYIRHALQEPGPERLEIIDLVIEFLHMQLAKQPSERSMRNQWT